MTTTYWGRRQRPSGCIRLGRMIRAARKHRGLSQSVVAARMNKARAYATCAQTQVQRCNVAQWEGAHRRISSFDLARLEEVLEVEFRGINRRARSQHHALEFCEIDLATYPEAAVTCRSTGNTLSSFSADQ